MRAEVAGDDLSQHRLQFVLGIEPIVPLLAHSLGSNLRRIAHPQFKVALGQQAIELTRVAGGLCSHAYADSLFLEFAIRLLGLPTPVCQPPLSAVSGFCIHPGNLLYAWVILAASINISSLLLVEPLVVRNSQVCAAFKAPAIL